MEEKERKAQELRERDNPKMCKPMEAIPMPYKGEGDEGQINLYKSNPKLDKNWHNDLKAVLFRKALLVYITLSEIILKYTLVAFICQQKNTINNAKKLMKKPDISIL